MAAKVELKQLPGNYSICLAPPIDGVPQWVPAKAGAHSFVNISYCEDELTIVCLSSCIPHEVPNQITIDDNWSAFKLEGSFAFDETGIVLSVIRPLSENNIGIFVVSTFHRDYLLVKTDDLTSAVSHLQSAGHQIIPLEAS